MGGRYLIHHSNKKYKIRGLIGHFDWSGKQKEKSKQHFHSLHPTPHFHQTLFKPVAMYLAALAFYLWEEADVKNQTGEWMCSTSPSSPMNWLWASSRTCRSPLTFGTPRMSQHTLCLRVKTIKLALVSGNVKWPSSP